MFEDYLKAKESLQARGRFGTPMSWVMMLGGVGMMIAGAVLGLNNALPIVAAIILGVLGLVAILVGRRMNMWSKVASGRFTRVWCTYDGCFWEVVRPSLTSHYHHHH